jgi:hypothetical protein
MPPVYGPDNVRASRLAVRATVVPPSCESFVDDGPGNVLSMVFAQLNDEVYVCGEARTQWFRRLQARLGSICGA